MKNIKDRGVKFRSREEKLTEKWRGKADNIPVNNQQYSFDSMKRQNKFIDGMFETDDERKRYKKYRAEWYRRAKEFDPGFAPLAVCCELVSTCNINCSMCYTITEEFQSSVVGDQRMLAWNVVKGVIDECADLGVPSMLFSWRGESTIYSSRDENGRKVKISDVLAYARKKGILEITSLTNGQMINEKMAEAIVRAEPSWLSFSIDGLENNYNKIRTPAKHIKSEYNAFADVVANIKRIVAIRNSLGKKRPQIRTNTIYPPIANDPMAYYEFMKGIGVGWVTVNEILDFRGDELPEEAILDNWACQYPFQRLTVAANGTILPCTGAHNEEDELVLGRYTGSKAKKIVVNGALEEKKYPISTLKEAWDSGELREIRTIHKENHRKNITACKHCRHGAVKNGVEWIPDGWNMEKMEWADGTWRE